MKGQVNEDGLYCMKDECQTPSGQESGGIQRRPAEERERLVRYYRGRSGRQRGTSSRSKDGGDPCMRRWHGKSGGRRGSQQTANSPTTNRLFEVVSRVWTRAVM